MTYNIAVLVGSLRRGSITRMVAHALTRLAPPTLHLHEIELGDLAMYNADLEDEPPEPWRRFRDEVRAADGVLFVTPEYNRSVPGVLKNAIDVGSRPSGANAWNGKPGAVVSVTSGALGAFGANHHLRQSLVYVNVPVMAQPEAYIGQASTLVDEQGIVLRDDTRVFFAAFMNAFAAWVARHAPSA
ncbi:MAG: NADPH-dependent FMN reductase [Gemmatimonadales bacterium]